MAIYRNIIEPGTFFCRKALISYISAVNRPIKTFIYLSKNKYNAYIYQSVPWLYEKYYCE